MHNVSINVDVEVDLDDIDFEDMQKYLKDRGYALLEPTKNEQAVVLTHDEMDLLVELLTPLRLSSVTAYGLYDKVKK